MTLKEREEDGNEDDGGWWRGDDGVQLTAIECLGHAALFSSNTYSNFMRWVLSLVVLQKEKMRHRELQHHKALAPESIRTVVLSGLTSGCSINIIYFHYN